jgi:hypothetical protein
MIQGRARSMGLGHVDDVSLVEARNKADAARKLVRKGTDPLDVRATEQATAKAITFGEVAQRYITTQEAGWRCAKHLTGQQRGRCRLHCPCSGCPDRCCTGRCRHWPPTMSTW